MSTTQIDARGPRFGAAVTTLVLAAAVLAGPGPLGTTLIAAQAIVFGLGAFVGLHAQPYGRIFAAWVKPRLHGPAPVEDAAPPRFAQLVGFIFAAVALVGALLEIPGLFTAAAAIALAAAFLNAAFAFCLGCEVFLLAKRLAA